MWFFDISYQDISTGRFLEPNQEFPFPQADTLYVHGSTQLDSSPCSLIRTLSVQKVALGILLVKKEYIVGRKTHKTLLLCLYLVLHINILLIKMRNTVQMEYM